MCVQAGRRGLLKARAATPASHASILTKLSTANRPPPLPSHRSSPPPAPASGGRAQRARPSRCQTCREERGGEPAVGRSQRRAEVGRPSRDAHRHAATLPSPMACHQSGQRSQHDGMPVRPPPVHSGPPERVQPQRSRAAGRAGRQGALRTFPRGPRSPPPPPRHRPAASPPPPQTQPAAGCAGTRPCLGLGGRRGGGGGGGEGACGRAGGERQGGGWQRPLARLHTLHSGLREAARTAGPPPGRRPCRHRPLGPGTRR